MAGGGGGGGAFDDGVAAGDLAIWHYSGVPCLCGVYVHALRGPAAVCAACVYVPRTTVTRRATRDVAIRCVRRASLRRSYTDVCGGRARGVCVRERCVAAAAVAVAARP